MYIRLLTYYINLMIIFSVVANIIIALSIYIGTTQIHSDKDHEYRVKITDVSSDGQTIQDTPVPTATPTAVPTPTATPVPVFSCPTRGGDWGWLVIRYNWSPWEACQVLNCESEGLQNAVSRTGCIGLFQVCPGGSFDPETNADQAYGKYLDGIRVGNRWYHWNQHGNCGHYF